MNSPIARGLMAAARLLEWGHRRIHGPKYRVGDIIEVKWYNTPAHVIRIHDDGDRAQRGVIKGEGDDR